MPLKPLNEEELKTIVIDYVKEIMSEYPYDICDDEFAEDSIDDIIDYIAKQVNFDIDWEDVETPDDIVEQITSQIDIDKLKDNTYSLCDSVVDVYTANLLNWYAKDVDRIYYAEEYLKSSGSTDFSDILRGGQFRCCVETYDEIIDLLESALDNLSEIFENLYSE